MAFLVALCVAATPGERLLYDVKYGPLKLGTMSLEVLEPDCSAGETLEHFRCDLEFTRSLSWLFWAQYRLESWSRGPAMLTARSYKRTREPNYRAEWTATYGKDSVRYSDGKSFAVPDSSRDMLTMWYFLRTVPLDPGDSFRAVVHADRRTSSLRVAVRGPKRVRTSAGVFDCLALTPDAGSPLGTVWLSNDESRIPVVIRTRIGGVAISAQLRQVER